MKKLFLFLIVALSLKINAQHTFPTNYSKDTLLVDGDYFMMSQSDSTITKATKLKYIRANSIKDTTPSTGNTVKITTGYNVLAVHASGTLAALTITLPVSPINGQLFTITADQIITSLTLSGGTTVTSYTAYAIASPIKLIYDTSLSKWLNR